MGVTKTPVDIGQAQLAPRLRLAVTRLARRLRQQIDEPTTPSQLSALASIDRLGGVTMGELASVERVQPPSMTRIVANLEEQGLIAREADALDRRVSRLRVTPAGRRLLERSRTRKTAYLASRLRELTPDQIARLEGAVELLETLSAP